MTSCPSKRNSQKQGLSFINLIFRLVVLLTIGYNIQQFILSQKQPTISKSAASGKVNDIQRRSNQCDNAYIVHDKRFSEVKEKSQMKINPKLNGSLISVKEKYVNLFENIEKQKTFIFCKADKDKPQDCLRDQKRQLHDLFMNCTLTAKIKNDFEKVSDKQNHLFSKKNPIFMCWQGKQKECAENAIIKLGFGKASRDFKVLKLKPNSPWKEDQNEDEISAMDTAIYVTCALILFVILAINLLYLFVQGVKPGDSRFKFQNLTLYNTKWSRTLLMAFGLLLSHAPVASEVTVSTTQGTYFRNYAPGRYLQGYINESFVVYDLIICQMRCNGLHSICKSLNYIENEHGSHICEINHEAEYCALPGQFIVRENSFYVETVPETDDAGLCSACGHRGVIKKTKKIPGFKCLCQEGFYGDSCEGLAYSIWFHRRSTADYVISHDGSPKMTAITACFWVKSNQKKGPYHFISYAATQKKGNDFLVAEETELYFEMENKPAKTIPSTNKTTTKDGSWHAICCSWSSHNGLYMVYKDGNIRDNLTDYLRGHNISGGGIWVLGQDQDKLGGGFSANQMLQGEITEVNIWNKVLSFEDIREFSSSCQSKLQGNVKSWKDFLAGVKGNARRKERPACCKV